MIMGLKDGTSDECWGMYANDESILHFTPETNITLYVNCILNKNLEEKNKGVTLYLTL